MYRVGAGTLFVELGECQSSSLLLWNGFAPWTALEWICTMDRLFVLHLFQTLLLRLPLAAMAC